jgi:steroid delta-isomerase-like uncharacterized protein
MSTENKAIFKKFMEEIWNKGNLGFADEVLSSDFLNYTPGLDVKGIEAFKQYVIGFRTAFPDLELSINDQFGEEEKVVTHWTATGTHKGEVMGIAPTGNRITLTGATITRFAGGKMAQNVMYWDRLGFLEQLGASRK